MMGIRHSIKGTIAFAMSVMMVAGLAACGQKLDSSPGAILNWSSYDISVKATDNCEDRDAKCKYKFTLTNKTDKALDHVNLFYTFPKVQGDEASSGTDGLVAFNNLKPGETRTDWGYVSKGTKTIQLTDFQAAVKGEEAPSCDEFAYTDKCQNIKGSELQVK